MAIPVSSESIASRHYLVTPLTTPDMKLFVFSGVASFNDKIKGRTREDWEFFAAQIEADYTNIIPNHRALQLTGGWVVDVQLASLFNRNQALNTGWAVNEFRLVTSDSHDRLVAAVNGKLKILAEVAVRDSDAFIHKLSYHVTIVGRLVEAEQEG
jgi:hypothetical protein